MATATTSVFTFTTNTELCNFIAGISQNETWYAIRTEGKIQIFSCEKQFNKTLKLTHNAVNGQITARNYSFYRFITFE